MPSAREELKEIFDDAAREEQKVPAAPAAAEPEALPPVIDEAAAKRERARQGHAAIKSMADRMRNGGLLG